MTLGIFLFLSTGRESDETSYTLMEDERLPVVSFGAEGQRVNKLFGCVEEMNEGTLINVITPLNGDRVLPLTIQTQGSTLTAISYEIRRISDRGLIEQGSLSGWDMEGEAVSAQIPVKDLIDKGTEYELIVRLTTEHHSRVSYYSRILWDEDLKTQKMLEYVTDFHASTFSSSEAEKYAINWEVDNSMDNETLSHVNIHSNFRQLTYRDLAPQPLGTPELYILEMDRQFGSFLVRSLMTAESEDGTRQTYSVEEYFCLQWSDERNAQNTTPFYLMSYERHMSQLFSAGRESVSGRGLHFGIVGEGDVEVTASPDKKTYAFTVGGELWTFSKADGAYTKLFTFHGNEREEELRVNNEYMIKVMETADSGDVTFLVCGYMNRGPHEGMTGVSVFKYHKETNDLTELKFIRSRNGSDIIMEEIETLAVKHATRMYFLLDDTVFVLSDNGGELQRMVENARKHSLCVNDRQTAIAWTPDGDARQASGVQLLYLETGKTQTVSAEEGEYLQAHGFIDNDFVVSFGKEEDIRPAGLQRSYPCYALTINAEDGSEAVRYQYKGVYVTGVTVGAGQVILERAKFVEGELEQIENDVLLQNASQREETGPALKFEKLEKREKVGIFPIDGLDNDIKASRHVPQGIVYSSGADQASVDDSTTQRYYAYGYGKLQGVYEEAGPAIAAIHSQMGCVADRTGARVWHRSAKDPARVTLSVSLNAEVPQDADQEIRLLGAIFRYENAELDVTYLAEKGLSAREILEQGLGVQTLDLEGCLIKQLYLFIAKGSPVLAVDRNGEAQLIIGYDASNILLLDPASGSPVRLGAELAEKQFSESGSVFLTYLK
ncbi:MAG: hypothetical protein J5865_05570 [Lachnospiraceae bacterium]|nr:hypothetical protein [Lachnospiraceae bacterium]